MANCLTAVSLPNFTNQLAAERTLPDAIVKMLRLLPKTTHPMDMLRTGVSMLGAVRQGSER